MNVSQNMVKITYHAFLQSCADYIVHVLQCLIWFRRISPAPDVCEFDICVCKDETTVKNVKPAYQNQRQDLNS